MNKDFEKSLHIFRRDLRVVDNTSLIQALEKSTEVVTIFIIDPRLVKRNRNDNSIEFMLESLKDLEKQLLEHNGKLAYFYGKPNEIVEEIIKREQIEAVFTNRDYTPFSIARDKKIKQICSGKNVEFYQSGDSSLNEPESIYNSKGQPYIVFTPYYRKASQVSVKYPKKNRSKNFAHISSNLELSEKELEQIIETKNPALAVHGGRQEGGSILSKIGELVYYERERNYPALDRTSHLSSYLKFGVLSVREVYHKIRTELGEDHPLLRQLYWRDFFTMIGYFFPRVFRKSFRQKYEKLKWIDNETTFQAWCVGKTGFPIVDAGMRELNETGYMHNRVRMIVASFLTKDMHVDWRKGEDYFAKKLVDFDKAVNNGNWQWSASTGCDAQPYFRIFNPWTQQKKYDPDCDYIKKWIPELREIKNEHIHKWFEMHETNKRDYPSPILDHKRESKLAKESYRNILEEGRREEKA